MICTKLCIILSFQLPREHVYQRYKKNNTNTIKHPASVCVVCVYM